MIKSFFTNVSYRFWKENDLSDFTWALCNASSEFQLLFLHFFFPNIEFDNITEFIREKSEDDSRPDFYLINKGITYLIECKINDQNHHFEQYEASFNIPKEQLGYITNYKMNKSGYTVRTWEEFYDEVLKNVPDNEIEEKLWLGYAEYLKSVCSIIKISKKMELKGMYSLYSFIEILQKLVNRIEDNFELKYYSDKNIQSWSGVSGKYFEINYKNAKIETTWAWIGVYYEREEPFICMGFEKKERWGKPVFDIIGDQFNEGEFASKPYLEEGTVWFELSDKMQKEFEISDLNGQILILKKFMDEVIDYPMNLLKR